MKHLLMLVISILMVGCGGSHSSSNDVSGELSGLDALNSVSRFSIQDKNPVLEWNLSSRDDLDFAIQACQNGTCLPFVSISCIGKGLCTVTDEWRGGTMNHRFSVHNENGHRSYRLEICDATALGFKSDVQIQIQAKDSTDQTGNWFTGQMTTLSMDGYCSFPAQAPDLSEP